MDDETGTITEGSMDVEEIIPYYGDADIKGVLKTIVDSTGDNNVTAAAIKEYCKDSVAEFNVTRNIPFSSKYKFSGIEVNGELDGLGEFIEEIVDRLETGGRIAVITFHSLEDRIVKQKLKWLEKDCVCPPKTPVCVCGKKAKVKVVTNKPITADSEERQDNPRSESAKLRIAQRI